MVRKSISDQFWAQTGSSWHSDETIYQNYDATYHVLLTIDALRQTPVSQHHFLPIVSLGDDSDKNIPWGTTIPDKYGNYYYTSFPLGGFVLPYFILNVLNLEATVDNLFLFSSLILVFSVILFFLLTQSISKYISTNGNPNISAFLAGLVYLFSMETLYSHGYVYWGHSLMQPVYLGFLYIIFKILTKQESVYSRYILFFLSFFLGFTEWSGYLIVLGAIVAIAISKIPRNKKYPYMLICAAGATLALLIFMCDFLFTVNAVTFFNALVQRFTARNFTNHISFFSLFFGYWKSFYFFLILLPLSLIYLHRTKNIGFDEKSTLLLLLIVMMFGLSENIIMKQHAIAYNFDRLKLLPFFSLAIPILWMSGSYSRKILIVFIISGTSVFSLYQYPKDRMWKNIALTQNKKFIEEGEFNRKCSSCVVGVGGPVRGYTNLLFGRGIYEGQTIKSIKALSEKKRQCACYVDVKGIGGGGMIKIEGFERYN